ncbi:MAG TPA: electron transport complex subunit RsxA, partial [Myxococcales bacterium]|nr:electron transport complex subunit RsxA [Myxococcales bacterium]
MELSVAGYFQLIFWAVFVNNFILAQFLGICPFLGVSKKIESSMGMGIAVVFVITVSSVITWLLYHLLLAPLGLSFLKTIVFILVIAALVQFVEMVIKKLSPGLFQALGIYLPLITTNCAVLGVTVLNIESGFVNSNMGLLMAVVQGVGGGIGFTLALILMAGIRERLEVADIPEHMKGLPITFIV